MTPSTKKNCWRGTVRWRDRTGSDEGGSSIAIGVAPHDGEIVFEYSWDGSRHIARFNMQSRTGNSRLVKTDKKVATFHGEYTLGEGYVELGGGPWIEDGHVYDWKAELEDIGKEDR